MHVSPIVLFASPSDNIPVFPQEASPFISLNLCKGNTPGDLSICVPVGSSADFHSLVWKLPLLLNPFSVPGPRVTCDVLGPHLRDCKQLLPLNTLGLPLGERKIILGERKKHL